ncbi:MAG: endolytic transglycosylase MltG [Xanthomonadales bacterium]|nr:endolytic transglycosylase MltG [Xanthomonadales bacterium]
MRIRLILAVLVLVAAGSAAYLYLDYQRFLTAPLAVGEDGLSVEMRPGMVYPDLVNQLVERRLTQGGWRWRLLGRQSPFAGSLQAGEYLFREPLTPLELLQKMASGEVVLHTLTVIEGWRFNELMQAVSGHPALKQTLPADAGPELVASELGLESVEGRFLPETYRFPRGTSDVEFLERARQSMDRVLARAWERRMSGLPYERPYEALIMASIIEKETGRADERGRIAGVFVRRLQKRMRLQTDPTVIYGLGDAFDGDLRRRDLRTDTPYNTYTRHGLPPTPIAMPGQASVEAALNPEDGDALYFVSRGDGSHVFSATLEEHNRAVDEYQRKRR